MQPLSTTWTFKTELNISIQHIWSENCLTKVMENISLNEVILN